MTMRKAFTVTGLTLIAGSILVGFLLVPRGVVVAASDNACGQLPSYADLKAALTTARSASNGGFNLDMWGSIVNRDGVVCAVAFTGSRSRIGMARQPGHLGSKSEHGQLVRFARAWRCRRQTCGGGAAGRLSVWLAREQPGQHCGRIPGSIGKIRHGKRSPGRRQIGGVNVFGGGLALYDVSHTLVGAIGVSGDTSCADHNIAWRTRHALNMDFVPGGVGPATRPDNINHQGLVPVPSLAADFSHPICKIAGVDGVSAISAALPPTQ